jgi:CBF1 interacting corepressor
MGGGLAFLSKKRFNPANFSNQRQVWEAKQKADLEERKIKDRTEQLKREREDEELARAMGGKVGGDVHQLKFMYDAPPGLQKQEPKTEQKDNEHLEHSHNERRSIVKQENDGEGAASQAHDNILTCNFHPGDDEAAAEFRKMLLQGTQNAAQSQADAMSDVPATAGEAALKQDGDETGDDAAAKADSSKVDTRTKLEKEAGRSIQSKAVTLKEQFERFPQLKNAPIAQGINVDNVHVAFKPMGETLRNVRCMKCGVWGHSVGDRECKLTGWNPFDAKPPPKIDTREKEVSRQILDSTLKSAPLAAVLDAASMSSPGLELDKVARPSRSSTVPSKEEDRKHRKKRRRSYSSSDDSCASKSSYDSADVERETRSRHHKQKKKKHSSSRSSSRRKESKKSSKKKKHRKEGR